MQCYCLGSLDTPNIFLNLFVKSESSYFMLHCFGCVISFTVLLHAVGPVRVTAHRLNSTSPPFHPVTVQDLKLISQRREITTCYQHRLIPDHPSVSVQSQLQSLFILLLTFNEINLISFFFGLTNLNPSRHFLSWTEEKRGNKRPCVDP